MELDLKHYNLDYYAKKNNEYKTGKPWKIGPFFKGLDVQGKTVIDYGSASGNMAKEALKLNARKVVAYDPIYDDHPEIMDLVTCNGIQFVTSDQLKSIDDKFDLVFCSDVIEHVVPKEIGEFISDLISYAHPASLICLNSPVKINLASIIGRDLASSVEGHINVMNPWRVIRLFQDRGYCLAGPVLVTGISKNRRIQTLAQLPFPLNSIWGGHYFLKFVSANAG